ncbi:pentatricopeptide repeat-containing protein At2g13600 [Cryptomeria japonica]|uniref:pentatricopeptide repeat-containing protein At2g13600 n=1 Tax=Cryptomeria japonica TaxID=3369 RepID=UPI0027DA8388|nr:pentatricopeptide repeat-containing protein At2g13600 [Cryptomeria japonica]
MQFPSSNNTMPITSVANLNLRTLCGQGELNGMLHILLTEHNTPGESNTYIRLLQICVTKKALSQGKQTHSLIIQRGYGNAIQDKLINMYVKCGSLMDARKAFDDMKEEKRDGFSWNAIIAAYRRHGYPHEALNLFHQMQRTGVQPDQFTFSSILQACSKIGALEQGMDIHQSVMERGYLSDVVVKNSLIDMYAKCGGVHKARQLFDKMPQKDVVSWTAMIAGYSQNGVLDKAVRLFEEMPLLDVVSWNAMVAGYIQNGFAGKALDTFKRMQLAGFKPNSTTFSSILPACANMGALEQGMEIHQSIIESGFSTNVVVLNSLIYMYAKCERIHTARELFDRMPQRDMVSWNAMITGYAQNGVSDQALKLFKEMPQPDVISWNAIVAGYAQSGLVEKAIETYKQMQLAALKPCSATFASIVSACAKMGALEQGIDIHQDIIDSGFLSDVIVASALVDMYSKCGSLQKAREVFDQMPKRNVISWNAMLAGYAQNGFCKDALELFELMKQSGTRPDHVSLACVLFACSHAGLVDEGCKYFNDVSDSYCITPTIECYACMVDLLGRAGYLVENLNFIIKMPIKPVAVVWMCFLGACRSHKNTSLGVFTANLLFELEPKNAAIYILLSNIYAEVGRWDEVQKVRRWMKDRGIEKIPGCSWIEVCKVVHIFCVGDRSHPQTQDIHDKLENLSLEMKAVQQSIFQLEKNH